MLRRKNRNDNPAAIPISIHSRLVSGILTRIITIPDKLPIPYRLDGLVYPYKVGIGRLPVSGLGKREKRQGSGPFDLPSECALMLCTGSGNSTRQNLTTVRDEPPESVDILVIGLALLGTELTDLSSEIRSAAAATTTTKRSATTTSVTTGPRIRSVPIIS